MKIILVLQLLISTMAFAYKAEQISISDHEFRRYIRPQLKSITNEFKSLIFGLNPELEPYRTVFQEFKSINNANQKFRMECLETKTGCESGLENLNKRLEKALSLLNQASNPSSKNFNSISQFETKLTHQHSREMLFQKCLGLVLKSQNILFHRKLTGKAKRDASADLSGFSNQVNYLYDQFNAFIIKSSDARFRNEFNGFWVNFIRPIENIALHRNNRDFFTRRLTELNMRWHMLHVRLTKRGFRAPKQVNTLLSIMDRRWINILKISLKTNR